MPQSWSFRGLTSVLPSLIVFASQLHPQILDKNFTGSPKLLSAWIQAFLENTLSNLCEALSSRQVFSYFPRASLQ